MAVNEKRVLYKIDSGRFFERKKETASWTEARKLIKEAAARSRNKTAYLTVIYDGTLIGIFDVDGTSTLRKPALEVGLAYDALVERAINLGACACSCNDVSVFFIDENRARISGNMRKSSRMKTRAGDIVTYVGYTDKNLVR